MRLYGFVETITTEKLKHKYTDMFIVQKLSKMTNTGVNIPNLITSFTGPAGFSNEDAICEFIDNSIDAKCNTITITCDDDSQTTHFADNGIGMSPETMPSKFDLYNNHASTSNIATNGKFGIGCKAGMIRLSGAKRPSTVITKTIGNSEPGEMKLDWPKAVQSNSGTFDRSPHDITLKGQKIWDLHNNNKSQGTIVSIQCDSSVYKDVCENIQNTANQIGIKYFKDIGNGLKIKINRNGASIDVISNNPIASVAESHISKNVIEIFKDKNGSLIFCYKNGKKQYVYVNSMGKETLHDPRAADTELTYMEGWDINITSGYSPTFKEPNSGCHFMRGNKIIERFPKPFPTSGDYQARELEAYARHIIQCPVAIDDVINIQINKSHIKEADIPLALRLAIHNVTRKYSTAIYNKFYKTKKERDTVHVINEIVAVPVNTPFPVPVPVPVHVQVKVPEPVPVKVPEPVKVQTKAPEPVKVQTKAPEPVPVPVQTKAPELVPVPVKAPEPVPVQTKAPEPVQVQTKAPEPVKAPVHYGIQFDISARPRELILTDTNNNTIIARLPTFGEGAALRVVLIALLCAMENRDAFIKKMPLFINALEK